MLLESIFLTHALSAGWVSQTPETHIVYLRGWAQDLGVPVLSVNYSLAPEHPFPHALDQCYAAYKCAHAVRVVGIDGTAVQGYSRTQKSSASLRTRLYISTLLATLQAETSPPRSWCGRCVRRSPRPPASSSSTPHCSLAKSRRSLACCSSTTRSSPTPHVTYVITPTCRPSSAPPLTYESFLYRDRANRACSIIPKYRREVHRRRLWLSGRGLTSLSGISTP